MPDLRAETYKILLYIFWKRLMRFTNLQLIIVLAVETKL